MEHGNRARAKVRQAFLPVCHWRRTPAAGKAVPTFRPFPFAWSVGRCAFFSFFPRSRIVTPADIWSPRSSAVWRTFNAKQFTRRRRMTRREGLAGKRQSGKFALS